MDDESFFTLANSTLTGNNSFYSNDVCKMSDGVKYYNKQNIKKKFWYRQQFHQKETSALTMPRGQGVNEQIYKQECLGNILVPFIF